MNSGKKKKKITCKASFMQNPFFVCSSYFTEQIYYISLLSPTHSPTFSTEGSMASSPLRALLLTGPNYLLTIIFLQSFTTAILSR